MFDFLSLLFLDLLDLRHVLDNHLLVVSPLSSSISTYGLSLGCIRLLLTMYPLIPMWFSIRSRIIFRVIPELRNIIAFLPLLVIASNLGARFFLRGLVVTPLVLQANLAPRLDLRGISQ